MPQQQKFHTGDVKSVWNLVRSSDWSAQQLYCFTYCLQMTDKRPQRLNVNGVINVMNLLQNSHYSRNYILVERKHLEVCWSSSAVEHKTLP